MKRNKVVVGENEALDHVKDGMTIAFGGFITAQHAMSMVRGIAKRKLKNLTVIGSLSSALDVDLLIGCGCISTLISAYVGAEATVPMGPFFKKAAEEEKIRIWETDEIIVAAMLKATASGIPFFPVRGGLGTDLPRLNPDLKEFKDKINNEPLLAVPAMSIDIAFTHASEADPYGNTRYIGNPFLDVLIHRAANMTITTVEKIVPPEGIRSDPYKTAYKADLIVRAPFGAHPYSCHGAYLEDEAHLTQYATAAYTSTKGDDTGWTAYRKTYIDTPEDHMAAFTVKELMACWLSRDLKDGEISVVGANFPIPRAAVLLAHFHHGPNMRVAMGSYLVNLETVDKVMTLKYFTDYRPVRWAESAGNFPFELFSFHKLDVFFISGIQIDAYGNTNLIGIAGEKKKFKFRGPGSIGTTTLSALSRRYYIVTEHHTPRLFVEKCDYISALGFGDGTKDYRKKRCLPGKGPRYCVTPLCVFDFSPDTHRMRLFSLHPGVTVDQVIENTGFKPEIPENISETPIPTKTELEILRNRVDPEGLLK